MGQAGNQVDTDVVESSFPQALNFFENGRTTMQSPDGLRFLIDERLHAQTTRFTPHCSKVSISAGVTVPGAHSTVISASGHNRKLIADRGENATKLRASRIDGVPPPR